MNDHIAIFNEMHDLWIMSISEQNTRTLLGAKLAELLMITPDHFNYLINLRKPEVSITNDSAIIGRAIFPKLQSINSR